MNLLLTLIVPLFLLAMPVRAAFAQLRHWTHPLRVVLETCSAGMLLIVASLVLPISGWIAIAWWTVLVLCAIGAGVATWRSWIRPALAVEDLTGRAAVNTRPVGARSLVGNAGVWLVAALVAVVGG